MATKNQSDMVCVRCGCEVCIIEEPSRGHVRSTTYCPVCKDLMVTRASLAKKVTVDTLCRKFGVTTYSEQSSIREKLRAAETMFRERKCTYSGKLGATDVYYVLSEDGRQSYVVTVRDGYYNCNCPDQLFRHHVCKHVITVMLHREKNEINPFK